MHQRGTASRAPSQLFTSLGRDVALRAPPSPWSFIWCAPAEEWRVAPAFTRTETKIGGQQHEAHKRSRIDLTCEGLPTGGHCDADCSQADAGGRVSGSDMVGGQEGPSAA